MNTSDNNNPFIITKTVIKLLAEQIQEITKTKPKPQNNSNTTQQEIIPRPLPITNLHKDIQALTPNNFPPTTNTQLGEDILLAI